jgi:hypothetical protein
MNGDMLLALISVGMIMMMIMFLIGLAVYELNLRHQMTPLERLREDDEIRQRLNEW